MLDLDKIQVGESSTDTDSAGGLSFTDASSVDVSGIIATWLARRGYSEAGYSELDRPLGGKLRNIDNMCRALHALKLSKSRLVILPDFDMDGIMSGVVGYAGLSQLGFDVELFTPDPTKGYGFNAEEADRLVREHRGVGAVITCDTGIGCVSGVRRFKELGIPVLVTDHHTENPNSSVRDMATVVVDPCAADETYPLREICGAFVFWMVLSRYAEMYLPSECEHIDVLRVFAGIGTVSDMMPLCHENRQVVRDAVSVCRLLLDLGDSYVDYVGGVKAYKSALSGLGACLRILDERHKFTKRTELTEETFGFYLSPIFNSVKRLGGDMALPFSVFSSLDLDTAGREQVFSSIVALNERRKSAVEDAMAQVEESVRSGRQPLAPYVYVCSSSTPAGVLGLVADTLAQRMARGYSVTIDGLGTFKAQVGLSRDARKRQEEEAAAPTPEDDTKPHSLNARSLEVTGVLWKPAKSLVRDINLACELKRGGEEPLRKSKYTLEERRARALEYLKKHTVMRVDDYVRLTGLSHSKAAKELDNLSGITSKGVRSSKVFFAEQGQ